MSFTRTYDLYINLAAGTSGPLLASTASLSASAKPTWNQNDTFLLRLWFLTPAATTNTAPTLTALDDGAVIVLGARPATDLEDGGLLFSATDFTEGGTADAPFYSAELNLNTAALATALTGQKSLAVQVDLQIQNADNTERLTVPQFAATILRDVIRGDEGVPVSGDPVYPVPAAIELVSHKGEANGYAALDGTGKVPADQLPAGADSVPIVLPYAAIIPPDASAGLLQKTLLTGDTLLNAPINATEGMRFEWWVTCDATSRNLAFDPAILIPSDSSFTSPKALTISKTYIVLLKYSGTAWMLASIVGGY